MTIQEQLELMEEEIKDLKEQINDCYSYIGKVTVKLLEHEQALAEAKTRLEYEQQYETAETVKFRKKEIRQIKKRIKACKEDLKYIPQKALQLRQELMDKEQEYFNLLHQVKFGVAS